ncbi:MAG: ligase-associated DNA damage response endonuclease PdeM [Microcoleaceae cyanobacterium]
MEILHWFETQLYLLPERAIYVQNSNSLLIADLHLGKSETFQAYGIPVPNFTNVRTLERLQQLCSKIQPQNLYILGDLFHSKLALTDGTLTSWVDFLSQLSTEVNLIIGNHDRGLMKALKNHNINFTSDCIKLGNLVLSHEPFVTSETFSTLNICGHIHPCIRLKSHLDTLRLPCFYFDKLQQVLTLPSFGEFTGGWEVDLEMDSIVYVIAENTVIPFAGKPRTRKFRKPSSNEDKIFR